MSPPSVNVLEDWRVGCLNSKMLLAPIMAIALVLLLAAAIGTSYLPVSQPPPHPTATPNSSALPTHAPQAMAASYVGTPLPMLFLAAAVVVGVAAAWLFFRERNSNKD